MSCWRWEKFINTILFAEKALFGEEERFFFSPRNWRYLNSTRPNKTTALGYWKATEDNNLILNSSGSWCLGAKKALTFYKGGPPKGAKTNCVMYEYKLLDYNRHHSHRFGGPLLISFLLSTLKNEIGLKQVHQPWELRVSFLSFNMHKSMHIIEFAIVLTYQILSWE